MESFLIELAAGTVAGFGLCLVGHPFDTAKVLLQSQDPVNPKYNGMMDALRTTVAQDGYLGLYKGVLSPLVGMGIFNAAQFAAFTNFRKLWTNDGADMSIARIMGAGAMTGSVVAFIEGPQDLIKSQLQRQLLHADSGVKPAFTNEVGCVKEIVGKHGLRGLGQGLSATIARNTIAVSLYFGGYEWAKRKLVGDMTGKSEASINAPAHLVLAAGAFGGLTYWSLCYPIDVIKTAMQTDAINPAERRFKGMFDAAKHLYRQGGLKAFARGIEPCLARSVPANAVCFACYEGTKSLLVGGKGPLSNDR